MDRILERLWIGSAEDGRDADRLIASGISAVMNATRETDLLSGFRYLRLDQDDCQPIPRGTIAHFLDWMQRSMDAGHTVLVQCGAGVSRASTFVIGYLMHVGFSWDEAEVLVRSKRPQVNPHPALKDSVLEYFRQ